jgi:hypothetical protein
MTGVNVRKIRHYTDKAFGVPSVKNANERALLFRDRIDFLSQQERLIPYIAVKALGVPMKGDTDGKKRDASNIKSKYVNNGGIVYDPSAKRGENSYLKLYVTEEERMDALKAEHPEPNWGWLDKPSGGVKPVMSVGIAKRYKQNPKTGGPLMSSEVDVKALPGQSIGERNPGAKLINAAARMAGVVVDALNKFRCPPGTPAANQFTDEHGTTCFGPSARTIARDVENIAGLMSRGGRRVSGDVRAVSAEEVTLKEATAKALGATRAAEKDFAEIHRIRAESMNVLFEVYGIEKSPDPLDTYSDFEKLWDGLARDGELGELTDFSQLFFKLDGSAGGTANSHHAYLMAHLHAHMAAKFPSLAGKDLMEEYSNGTLSVEQSEELENALSRSASMWEGMVRAHIQGCVFGTDLERSNYKKTQMSVQDLGPETNAKAIPGVPHKVLINPLIALYDQPIPPKEGEVSVITAVGGSREAQFQAIAVTLRDMRRNRSFMETFGTDLAAAVAIDQGVNPWAAFGEQAMYHEHSHLNQFDAIIGPIDRIIARDGLIVINGVTYDKPVSEWNNSQVNSAVMGVIKGGNPEIDIQSVFGISLDDLIMSRIDAVAGEYSHVEQMEALRLYNIAAGLIPREFSSDPNIGDFTPYETQRNIAMFEMCAELYSARKMGLIDSEQVDDALGWMDDTKDLTPIGTRPARPLPSSLMPDLAPGGATPSPIPDTPLDAPTPSPRISPSGSVVGLERLPGESSEDYIKRLEREPLMRGDITVVPIEIPVKKERDTKINKAIREGMFYEDAGLKRESISKAMNRLYSDGSKKTAHDFMRRYMEKEFGKNDIEDLSEEELDLLQTYLRYAATEYETTPIAEIEAMGGMLEVEGGPTVKHDPNLSKEMQKMASSVEDLIDLRREIARQESDPSLKIIRADSPVGAVDDWEKAAAEGLAPSLDAIAPELRDLMSPEERAAMEALDEDLKFDDDAYIALLEESAKDASKNRSRYNRWMKEGAEENGVNPNPRRRGRRGPAADEWVTGPRNPDGTPDTDAMFSRTRTSPADQIEHIFAPALNAMDSNPFPHDATVEMKFNYGIGKAVPEGVHFIEHDNFSRGEIEGLSSISPVAYVGKKVAKALITNKHSGRLLKKMGVDEDDVETIQYLGGMAAAGALFGPIGIVAELARTSSRPHAEAGLSLAVAKGWISPDKADVIRKKIFDTLLDETPEDVIKLFDGARRLDDTARKEALEIANGVRDHVEQLGLDMKYTAGRAKAKVKETRDKAKAQYETVVDKVTELRDRAAEVKPGWYADISRIAAKRFYNGEHWTEEVIDHDGVMRSDNHPAIISHIEEVKRSAGVVDGLSSRNVFSTKPRLPDETMPVAAASGQITSREIPERQAEKVRVFVPAGSRATIVKNEEKNFSRLLIPPGRIKVTGRGEDGVLQGEVVEQKSTKDILRGVEETAQNVAKTSTSGDVIREANEVVAASRRARFDRQSRRPTASRPVAQESRSGLSSTVSVNANKPELNAKAATRAHNERVIEKAKSLGLDITERAKPEQVDEAVQSLTRDFQARSAKAAEEVQLSEKAIEIIKKAVEEGKSFTSSNQPDSAIQMMEYLVQSHTPGVWPRGQSMPDNVRIEIAKQIHLARGDTEMAAKIDNFREYLKTVTPEQLEQDIRAASTAYGQSIDKHVIVQAATMQPFVNGQREFLTHHDIEERRAAGIVSTSQLGDSITSSARMKTEANLLGLPLGAAAGGSAEGDSPEIRELRPTSGYVISKKATAARVDNFKKIYGDDVEVMHEIPVGQPMEHLSNATWKYGESAFILRPEVGARTRVYNDDTVGLMGKDNPAINLESLSEEGAFLGAHSGGSLGMLYDYKTGDTLPTPAGAFESSVDDGAERLNYKEALVLGRFQPDEIKAIMAPPSQFIRGSGDFAREGLNPDNYNNASLLIDMAQVRDELLQEHGTEVVPMIPHGIFKTENVEMFNASMTDKWFDEHFKNMGLSKAEMIPDKTTTPYETWLRVRIASDELPTMEYRGPEGSTPEAKDIWRRNELKKELARVMAQKRKGL